MFIRGSRRPPSARQFSKDNEKVVWMVTWSTGKCYRAIVSLADGSMVFETAAKKLPVAAATAERIEPQMRKAIQDAERDTQK